MKLDYQVYLFDDQPDSIDISKLERRLAREGFRLLTERVSSHDDLVLYFDSPRKCREADLVLVDWNLGLQQGKDGAVLAQKIRKVSTTDMLFYSSESPSVLREKIYDKGVDGVFCVERTGVVDRALDIAQHSIRRYSTLGAMRSLAISRVAECDAKMNKAFLSLFERLSETDQATLRTELCQAVSKLGSQNATFFGEGAAEKHIRELTSHRAFTTAVRVRTLLKALKISSIDEAERIAIVQKLKSYESEINQPRNQLAHAQEMMQDSESVLVGYENTPWTQDRVRQFRQHLVAHENNIDRLLDLLT